MSTPRILILLCVLVVVLFVISLAVGSRTRGTAISPTNSWLASLMRPQALAPAEVLATNGWQNGRLNLPKGVRQAVLEITKSRTGQTIRRAQLTLQGAGTFNLQFTPRPHREDPETYADPAAAPLRMSNVKPGGDPLDLTILEHGGWLTIERSPATLPAVVILK